MAAQYFNPRSPCRERQLRRRYHQRLFRISIHALHVESDQKRSTGRRSGINFNPRSPCRERLDKSLSKWLWCGSTYTNCTDMLHFNPRSPCRERLIFFNLFFCLFFISIHALHVESDSSDCIYIPYLLYFNPRSPCRERLHSLRVVIYAKLFQSTLSM